MTTAEKEADFDRRFRAFYAALYQWHKKHYWPESDAEWNALIADMPHAEKKFGNLLARIVNDMEKIFAAAGKSDEPAADAR